MINPISQINTIGQIGKTQEIGKPVSNDFINKLGNEVQKIKDLEQQTNNYITNTVLGKSDDMDKAIVSIQKLDIAYTYATTITSKAISTYREIMNIQA